MTTQDEDGYLIRPYVPGDKDACLRVFASNVPDFFLASEEPDFLQFLDHPGQDWAYQVILRDGVVVACGGLAPENDGMTASLCWGMVDRGLHGSGLGDRLTRARIDAARAMPGITRVRLGTTQLTQGFYARYGFEAEAVVTDGYGAGLDRWDMVLRL